MNDMRDRLIKLLENEVGMTLPNFMAMQTIKLLADHLIKNGVIILPCKAEHLPYCVKLSNCLIYAPSHEEYEKVIGDIYTTAIGEFLNRLNELIHEAEMHGAYEPDIAAIINKILKEMEII